MRVGNFIRKLGRQVEKKSAKSLKNSSATPQVGNQAFGDFFVHEDCPSGIEPEGPSKYTSYVVSEGFQEESEMIYVAKLKKTAIWKLDVRLLPLMGVFYFFSEMTRLSLDTVRFLGLQEDLAIDNSQFSSLLMTALIPFILVQIPSNVVLHRVGARFFFPSILTLLGLVTFCHGFLVNYTGLLIVRFFSGLLQGPIFPGFLLYLSTLYTRSEFQWRIGLFYSAGCLSGGFSPSLSFAIARLDGTLGFTGWTWFFLIEGFFTILCGLLGFVLLPSSLEHANFLTPEEKKVLSQSLHKDHSPLTAGLDAKPLRSFAFQIWRAICSPHVFMNCLALFFAGANVTSLTYLESNVIRSLVRPPLISQILRIPPYTLSFLTVLIAAYISDKYQARALPTILWSGISAIGFSMLYASGGNNFKYASLFLIVTGAYGVIPGLVAWLSNNSAPYARKATSISLGAISCSSGGLISTLLFAHPSDSNDATAYTMINIASSMFVVILCLANLGYLTFIQAIKTHQRDEILQHCATSDSTADSSMQDSCSIGWEDLGDRHPDFQYLF